MLLLTSFMKLTAVLLALLMYSQAQDQPDGEFVVQSPTPLQPLFVRPSP